jgi:DNA primase
MSLPADFLDELRARVGLAALIGRRVKLVRAGREMKGCCPFHNEKTPSFYVNEDKGFYHCFGCGAHGDAIGFAMADGGLSFIEAVKQLAAEAGLAVPDAAPRDAETARRAELTDCLDFAARWYQQQLDSLKGADARAYLDRRAVSPALAKQFGLGLAPDSRTALSAALKAEYQSLDPAMLLAAGLAGESEDGARYDRFRGRLMFPIHSRSGKMVGFGGRALGAVEPKYLNSAEGPLFAKGRLLYNFHRAAPAARKSGRLLIVEGYMDVIGLARVGIPTAVAPLGTALTEDQLALAWSVVDEPVLAFDGDGAGARAAARAGARALTVLKPGKSLRFASLPAGQDPDDLARSGGAPAIEVLLQSAQTLERFLFDSEAAVQPLDTPERRAALRQRLTELAGTIAEPELRRDYQRTWLDRAQAQGRTAAPSGRPRTPAPTPRGRWAMAPDPGVKRETRALSHSRNERMIAMLLKSFAIRPDALARHAEALAELPLQSASHIAYRDALLDGATLPALAFGTRPLLAATLADDEFDRRAATTLASLQELHHIDAEMQPRDVSSAEAFAQENDRQQVLRLARDAAIKRLSSLASLDTAD